MLKRKFEDNYSQQSIILQLPKEIISHVFNYLNNTDSFGSWNSVLRTCKKFKIIGETIFDFEIGKL